MRYFHGRIDASEGNDLAAPAVARFRTLMELLNQLDGFDVLGKVKMVMATNRPDVLDPALMRPGRLDRKIEIPLRTTRTSRGVENPHTGINKHGEIDYEAVAKVAENQRRRHAKSLHRAGMFAIREDRDYNHDDFIELLES